MNGRELLNVAEFCQEWKVARSTFYRWLAIGEAPEVFKLPNGQLRMERSAIDAWATRMRLSGLEVA